MVENIDNFGTEGLSGKIGNIVFSRRKADGRGFAKRRPVRTDKEPTPAQQAIRETFQQATVYALAVNADPVKKEAYKQPAKAGQTAYNVAVKDFFTAPAIRDIDISGYTGAPGSQLKITVSDDFNVSSVHVGIENADGSLIEEGNAILDTNGTHWVYRSTE